MQDRAYFRNFSTPQIQAAVADIWAALEIARNWPDKGAGEAKYLDQLSEARFVLREREGIKNTGCCSKCGRGW